MSDSNVEFIGLNSISNPETCLWTGKTFKDVNRVPIESYGEFKMSSSLQTDSRPYRVRYFTTLIYEDRHTHMIPGMICAAEMMLINTIFMFAGLSVTELIVKNIESLSSIKFVNIPSKEPRQTIKNPGILII